MKVRYPTSEQVIYWIFSNDMDGILAYMQLNPETA